jgi:hypothetical protein
MFCSRASNSLTFSFAEMPNARERDKKVWS